MEKGVARDESGKESEKVEESGKRKWKRWEKLGKERKRSKLGKKGVKLEPQAKKGA